MDNQENNQNQQPGSGEPSKEQQDAMQRVKDFHDKLAALGLDMNFMFDMMGGVAENFVKKSEQRLSGLIDLKVKTLGDTLAKQVQDVSVNLNNQLTPIISFVNQLQQGVSQAQGQQPGGPGNALVPVSNDIPPGPGLGAGGGGNNPLAMINNIAPILKMLGLVPGGGNSEASGMEQMIKAAQGYGEFVKAIMAPITEMQTTMRQSLLQEMQTYSRTGGSLPWDEKEEPAQPRRQVAQLNQPRRDIPELDYGQIAIELAKKIKIV